MIKTLSKARKQERVKFRIPRNVQDCIPIRHIWADGIFQVGHQFSKTWSFTDINYSIAGKDDKTAMFLDYCDPVSYTHLMELVAADENILLAYRNISKNKGSKTAGTDGKTVRYLSKFTNTALIHYIKRRLEQYQQIGRAHV